MRIGKELSTGALLCLNILNDVILDIELLKYTQNAAILTFTLTNDKAKGALVDIKVDGDIFLQLRLGNRQVRRATDRSVNPQNETEIRAKNSQIVGSQRMKIRQSVRRKRQEVVAVRPEIRDRFSYLTMYSKCGRSAQLQFPPDDVGIAMRWVPTISHWCELSMLVAFTVQLAIRFVSVGLLRGLCGPFL
jgi:hypothetical protein